MKRVAIALATAAALMLPSIAMADLSPEQTAKVADSIRDARHAERLAFQTKASKAAYNKIVKSLNTKAPGRSCDAEDWFLVCDMEDGKSISVEAVPVNITKDKATDLCTNPYATSPEAITFELKGNPKQGFLMLWCTTEARDWSVAAAEKRKEWAKAEAAPVAEVAEIKITNGKLIPFGGSVRQAISIKNNTRTAERQLFVECGFFLNGELVGTGLGGVGNLMPGATKHTSVLGLDIRRADKVECNVKN